MNYKLNCVHGNSRTSIKLKMHDLKIYINYQAKNNGNKLKITGIIYNIAASYGFILWIFTLFKMCASHEKKNHKHEKNGI